MKELFVLLVIFKLKHFIADYPFQTSYMLQKFKAGREFILPLTAHAGVHSLFTFYISIFFAALRRPESAQALPFYLALGDFTLHFIMDRVKASPGMLGRYKALSAAEFTNATDAQKKSNKYFWWSLGFDQMFHGISDLAVAFILVIS